MSEAVIRFDDGNAYETMMGLWSRLVGDIFLDWLAPDPGLHWIDVGCGNGAFTERLIERCAPTEAQGIDPSEAQIAYARGREGARGAIFQIGDAMALPFERSRFDAAVMALVIFFVPDPAKSVTEMARVVRPGGTVASYAWDMDGGGFPYDSILAAMRDMGLTPLAPPSADASRMDALRDLWADAGLQAVETREISVERHFSDFEDFWAAGTLSPRLRALPDTLSADALEQLKSGVRNRLAKDGAGRIVYSARANAIKGRVPA
jgi:ubiquinone/menaquinone biosynthesis C-methylase UbiE